MKGNAPPEMSAPAEANAIAGAGAAKSVSRGASDQKNSTDAGFIAKARTWTIDKFCRVLWVSQ